MTFLKRGFPFVSVLTAMGPDGKPQRNTAHQHALYLSSHDVETKLEIFEDQLIDELFTGVLDKSVHNDRAYVYASALVDVIEQTLAQEHDGDDMDLDGVQSGTQLSAEASAWYIATAE